MAPQPREIRTIGITGATGCIGSMLVRHLSRTPSVHVRALVRRRPGTLGADVDERSGDLFARGALEALVAESDAILHLAARNPSSPTEDQRKKVDFFATNSWGTGAVAHFARAYEKPLVYTSTVAVYELGGDGSGPVEEREALPARRRTREWSERALEGVGGALDAWAEGNVENPRQEVAAFLREDPPPMENVYGLSKFLGERWVRKAPQGIVLRLSDVYGPGHEGRGILQEYLGGVLDGRRVSVDFGPRARVSFVYLADVLQALLRSVAGEGLPAQPIINVAHPRSVTPEELRDVLLTYGGHGLVRVGGGRAEPAPGTRRPFATHRAERLFGTRWTSLAEGIDETLRYLRLPSTERMAYRFPDLLL